MPSSLIGRIVNIILVNFPFSRNGVSNFMWDVPLKNLITKKNDAIQKFYLLEARKTVCVVAHRALLGLC